MDGEAVARDLRLRREGQFRPVERKPLRDENLRAHQVDAGDDLGDGVLDLDARVHLDEEPLVGVEIEKEFDGAGVVVADAAANFQRGIAQFLANARFERHGRGDFHDLLMAALHGAIALVQVQDVAVAVAEHLHLDVLGAGNVFFQENGGIAEGAAGLVAGLVQKVGEVAGLGHHAHAAATAAERGLDDEREADFAGDFQGFGAVFDGIFRARQDGHVDFLRERAGGDLVAHEAEQFRAGADEGDAGVRAGLGEIRVFRKKAVPGMDEVHALFLRERDDAGDVEVRADGAFALADEVGFIGLETVDAEAVFLGVDGDGAEAEFRRSPEYANGDFTAIGDEEFLGRTRRGVGFGVGG